LALSDDAHKVRCVETLSAEQARRIGLAAQGFADPRPKGRIDARHIRRVIERIGLLQLDSVNVFCRSHYLPVLARLGPYPRSLLDRLSAHHAGPIQRELVEYWAHEASLVPIETYPRLRWRMDRAGDEAWGRMQTMAREQPELPAAVLDQVEADGPLRSAHTGFVRSDRTPGQMWNWHDGKVALEYLFWAGKVMASRRVNFERWYDLPERVLPPEVAQRAALPVAEQQRELVRIAARAYGVATEPDLGDYFRLPRAESKARVAELVEAGELVPVEVAGWGVPSYLWPDARRPRRVQARALLSPFDPLIWFRDRAERLFGFRYRIEIYTPAPKRVYGYYVLPFLLDDRLVARVDLKSDRTAGALRVQSAYAEARVDRDRVAGELAEELRQTADWLGLGRVEVMDRGDLAGPLRTAILEASGD
jgi:uncharacterized protein YcaQ